MTRRRAPLPQDLVEGPAVLTPQQLAEQYGTDPADLSLITTVLAGHGLTVTSADAGARRVTVAGTLASMSATFGATLRLVSTPDPVSGRGTVEHRYREGGLQIPAELARHRARGTGPGRPAAGPGAVPARPGRRGPGRADRACAPAPPTAAGPALRSLVLRPRPRHPPPHTPPQVARAVPVPGGHRRDRADHRDHRARRGIREQRPGPLTSRGWASPAPSVTAASVDGAVTLLEISMDGARSILLSITGGRDLSLWEVNDAARAVSEAAHPDANIIFGAMVDEKLEDQVWVTVVATGYGDPVLRPGRHGH